VRNHFDDAFAELLERERLATWLVPEPAPDFGLPLLAEPAFIILELEVLGQRSYELACKLTLPCTAQRHGFRLGLMNHRVAAAICVLVVFASMLSSRPSGADNEADRKLREQITTPTREEMVIDNALAGAMADFNEVVPRLDMVYAKSVADRRQKKVHESDLRLLCAYRGNTLDNSPTATQSQ
jgi:hypothetical protein